MRQNLFLSLFLIASQSLIAQTTFNPVAHEMSEITRLLMDGRSSFGIVGESLTDNKSICNFNGFTNGTGHLLLEIKTYDERDEQGFINGLGSSATFLHVIESQDVSDELEIVLRDQEIVLKNSKSRVELS